MPHQAGDALEVRVLGPTQIAGPDGPIVIARRLERALAVRLALAHGGAVSDDVLAEDLWGAAELTRPAERLRVIASRLRTALGPAASYLTREDIGYALQARPADLDAVEAARAEMKEADRRADVRRAREASTEALRHWRGPALADLRSLPFGRAQGERLDALQLDLRVELVAAETELGHSSWLVAELTALAQAHPLHERIRRLFAVALYRDGRQADALATLAELRRSLADELGVDPAERTVELEVRLLRHDPSLDAPEEAASLPEPHLPVLSSTFVGRDGEAAALVEEVRSGGIATLTGSPGTGKTRLALEVAGRVRQQRRPVVWVDLAPLGESGSVLPAIGAAAGVDAGAEELTSRVISALSGALLVLDNAEHLVDAVAEAVTRLRPTPGLSVLVTSQRPLLLAEEELHHVGALTPSAAAALFCERSGAPRDSLVDAVCAGIDHLPLGIELAAGLTRTLTVAQVAARIDDRLHLLVGGSRDTGARHTSLRGALDWSYGLLDEGSAAALRRLSIFAGGCTLEVAEQVIAGGPLPVAAVAIAITDLVERCLVSVTERGGFRRFFLLESVRLYAAERLVASGEDDDVRARHLAWCAAHVARHDVQGEDPARELQALFDEWPNLLTALENAPGSPRAADGLRLAVALDDAWMFRGLHDQARRHYGALIGAEGVSDAERAHALSNYGFVSSLVGDTDLAAALLDRATRLAESADVPELAMRVLYHRGIACIESGHPRDAFELLHQGEQIAQRLERPRAVSAFRDVIATAHLYSGDAAEAIRLHHEANADDRDGQRTHGLVRGLVNEASARVSAGDLEGAVACAIEGADLAESLGDLVAVATLRAVHGHVAVARGDTSGAVDLFAAALADLGSGEVDAQLCRLDMADAMLRAGRVAEARTLVESVIAASPQRGVPWLMAQPTLAGVLAASGDLDAARELLLRTEGDYDQRGFAWQLALDRIALAREALARPGRVSQTL